MDIRTASEPRTDPVAALMDFDRPLFDHIIFIRVDHDKMEQNHRQYADEKHTDRDSALQ